MNLGEMKEALKRYGGVDDNDPLTAWINAALHEFEEAYEWPFLEAQTFLVTTPGEESLTLPSDYFKTIKLKLVLPGGNLSTRKIVYKTQIEFEEGQYNILDQGYPRIYTLLGSTMSVWPVPDDIYSILLTYIKATPILVDDVDVLEIPLRYHYTIVEGAAVKALQSESEEGRAETARGIFEDSISRHISAISPKQSGEFDTVRDVMEYGN